MRLRVDPFIVALVVTAVVATLLPAEGTILDALALASKVTIALLFFSYGVRLPTRDVVKALGSWRLHGVILATTFVLFPLLGLTASQLPGLDDDVATGILVLTLVPSTIQSSVAFTSIARGNVPGAVVSASLSNLLGVVLTPLLVALLVAGGNGAKVDADAVMAIALILLAPFVIGQLARPLLTAFAEAHARPLRLYERSTILLVVYVAFSEGSTHDIWSTLDATNLGLLAAVCAGLLAIALAWTWLVSRPFDQADRAAIVFCGTHKSLASGLPMISVMFAESQVALMVLPLMLYHQLQLMVCAWLAARWGSQSAV